jgi:hypothetical protein
MGEKVDEDIEVVQRGWFAYEVIETVRGISRYPRSVRSEGAQQGEVGYDEVRVRGK